MLFERQELSQIELVKTTNVVEREKGVCSHRHPSPNQKVHIPNSFTTYIGLPGIAVGVDVDAPSSLPILLLVPTPPPLPEGD